MSLAEKLDILKLHDDGIKFSEISRMKNMKYESVRGICQRKDQIYAQAASGTPRTSKTTFIARSRAYEKMEKHLSLWILNLDKKGIKVVKSQIQNQARALFTRVKENLEDMTEKEANEIEVNL